MLVVLPISLLAQFDGIVGTPGCKAIKYNDPRIVGWATKCTIHRGYQNIANKSLGRASFGSESDAVGPILDADSTNTSACVSLGDSGVVVLQFQHPIMDGEGYDFAVYENSFSDTFLELALVYVSSDSVHWFGFPAISNTPTDVQVDGFGSVDATKINNIAGKYRIGWGTPFDLAEIFDDPNLDKQNVRYVKLVDVIGTIDPQYATRDSRGKIINDPYSTPFWSSGFDLSGVAVLHHNAPSSSVVEPEIEVKVFPNPCADELYVKADDCQITLYTIFGQKVTSKNTSSTIERLSISELPRGIYLLEIKRDGKIVKTEKIVKK